MNLLRSLLAPPLLALALLGLVTAPALASPVTYPFRVTDNSGALVPSSVVAVGSTILTPGTPTTVPAGAGERVLSTGLAPAGAITVTLLDYGTGDDALVYDPANGEVYFPLTVSKSGSTLTNGNALIPLVCAADSSTILANFTASTANSSAIAALPGNSAIASDVQGGLTSQGYTITRSGKLDNADVAVSTRSTYAGGPVASVTGSVGSVASTLVLSSTQSFNNTGQIAAPGWLGVSSSLLPGEQTLLSHADVATSSRLPSGPVTLATAEHTLIGSQDVPAGLTAQGLTSTLVTALAAQVARIYGSQWGTITQSGGVYSVAMPAGALTIPSPGTIIGTVAPAYDSSGKPSTTTKTVN